MFFPGIALCFKVFLVTRAQIITDDFIKLIIEKLYVAKHLCSGARPTSSIIKTRIKCTSEKE
jgi:hypothetical protein